jgi:hypothetical protein
MYTNKGNHIGGVLVSMLAFSVVDRGFVPWSGKTKDYETERATLLIYIQDNCKNFEHLSPNNKLIWLLSSEDTLLLNKLAVAEYTSVILHPVDGTLTEYMNTEWIE